MPFVFTRFRLIALSAFGGYLHARDVKVAWGCMFGGFHGLGVIFSIFIIPVCHLDAETRARVSADTILRHTTKIIMFASLREWLCDVMLLWLAM